MTFSQISLIHAKIIDMETNTKTAFTTLKDSSEYYEQALSLIEKAFGYEASNSFATDFLPLMDSSNHANNHLLVDQATNKLIGHIGLSLRKIQIGSIQTPVALLGGIAVDDHYRRQGHFSKLLNHVVDIYKDKVSLFILWSEQNKLYQKFNFFQAGGQLQSGENVLAEDSLSIFQKTKFADLSQTDFLQIQKIYHDYTCKAFSTFVRNQQDWDIIKRISSCDLYIRKDSQNTIVSYFCINKGFDLSNIIHEVGCLPEYKEETYQQLSDYKMWLPEKENSYFQKDSFIYMALFKIGNEELFKEFISEWSNSEIAVTGVRQESVSFWHNQKQYSFAISEFLNYLFGPNPLEEFKDYKYPLYFAGVDSI